MDLWIFYFDQKIKRMKAQAILLLGESIMFQKIFENEKYFRLDSRTENIVKKFY